MLKKIGEIEKFYAREVIFLQRFFFGANFFVKVAS